MAKYSANMQGVTLSTSADFHTLVSTATLQGSVLRVYEIWLSGEAGATSVARVAVNRASAVGITIGGRGHTPEKGDPPSGAAPFSLAGAPTPGRFWGTHP